MYSILDYNYVLHIVNFAILYYIIQNLVANNGNPMI
jgi:hypothetical protein